jgi:sarcosine oxidase subunit gamma
MVEAAAIKPTVEERGATERFVFRGGAEAVEACGRAFDFGLPTMPLQSRATDDHAALWLGPDEWLLIAQNADIFSALHHALGDIPHALVDVSSRDCVFDIHGANSALLLNTAIPLDLSEKAFPVGMCTRTILGKVGALLWRTEANRFQLSVARSHGDFARLLLDEALRSMPES